MEKKRSIWVVIPALVRTTDELATAMNTAGTLRFSGMEFAKREGVEVNVWLVAQGKFSGRAKPNRVGIIAEPTPLGKGGAIKRFLWHRLPHPSDVIIVVDSDLPMGREDVFRATEPILREEADVVFGRRDKIILPPPEGDPGSTHERIEIELLVNTELLSRAFQLEKLPLLELVSLGYDFQSSLTSWRSGIPIDWNAVPSDMTWLLPIVQKALAERWRIAEVKVTASDSVLPSTSTVAEWRALYESYGYLKPESLPSLRQLMQKLYAQYLPTTPYRVGNEDWH